MLKLQCYLIIVLIFCSGAPKVLGAYQSNRTQSKYGYPKLRLVSVLFRHGDRTLEKTNGETYPNDPYKNYNSYPEGEGQLTNVGKRRAYQLGTILREMYNHFLGDVYYQPNVYARSTALTRCKMTLQLVFAALYPPANVQMWNPELSWQPMNIVYSPASQDGLLLSRYCSAFTKAFAKMLQTPSAMAEIRKFNGLMQEMSFRTGANYTDMDSLFLLYHTFATQSSLGLRLPEWAYSVFPDGKLLDAMILDYKLYSYNDELARLNGGKLLYWIIQDMNGVIDGTLKDRKINILAGHDISVVALLQALGIFDDNLPPYTSGVIVELREADGRYFVRVLQYLGIPAKIVELSIPGCDVLCPYDKFVQLRSATTATGEDPTCPLDVVEV